ncbi:hypothetical protein [Paraburkholderia adhaesiva]|uniref:hypothetical protein n=1 Tax=Paraburkholderia adhaesiva TaxID=2883244 RepID=UPI001F3A3BA4|nr:hypothetical protein [Paraburkholderia adhaesiva]
MGKTTGQPASTNPAVSRVTTLISFASIVTLLRHRIIGCLSSDEYQAGDESGWAFENIRYLPDGQIDVSDYLAVLLTEVLTGGRSYMRHPRPQIESLAMLRQMGLDEECARALNHEMFSAALDLILEHLPQSAFNDRGEFDFLLSQFDLIAMRTTNRTITGLRPAAAARSMP